VSDAKSNSVSDAKSNSVSDAKSNSWFDEKVLPADEMCCVLAALATLRWGMSISQMLRVY